MSQSFISKYRLPALSSVKMALAYLKVKLVACSKCAQNVMIEYNQLIISLLAYDVY